MKLNIFDPSRGQFVNVDAGQIGMEALMFNVLLNVRVMNRYMAALNPQIKDDLTELILDEVNDPPSFAPTSL
jgi:hypothetical protein